MCPGPGRPPPVTELFELIARGVLMGVAGTALMEVWSLVLRRRFGIPTLDYRLLGGLESGGEPFRASLSASWNVGRQAPR